MSRCAASAAQVQVQVDAFDLLPPSARAMPEAQRQVAFLRQIVRELRADPGAHRQRV